MVCYVKDAGVVPNWWRKNASCYTAFYVLCSLFWIYSWHIYYSSLILINSNDFRGKPSDKPAPCLTQTMDKEVKNAFFQELLDRQINRNNKDTTS